MGLKIGGLLAGEFLEAEVLGFHFQNHFFQFGELCSGLESFTIGPAAFQVALFVQQTGDFFGIGAGFAQADVGVLTQTEIGPF